MSIQRSILAAACALLPIDALSAPAQVYFGILSGPNETPPIPSPGVGFALVTYTPDDFMMRVQVSFSGLVANTTAAHIHCCFVLPMTTAGVATTTPYFTGFPIGVTAGTYDHTFDMTLASSYNAAFVTAQGSIGAALNAMLAGMANGTAYFNIHSMTYAGGEIRSNMKPDALFANGFEA